MTINHLWLIGSNVESVEVTEEAVKGMSGPTFYYAEVSSILVLWYLTNVVYFASSYFF